MRFSVAIAPEVARVALNARFPALPRFTCERHVFGRCPQTQLPPDPTSAVIAGSRAWAEGASVARRFQHLHAPAPLLWSRFSTNHFLRMTTPASPQPPSAPHADVKNVTPGLAEMLHQFWTRNRNLIVAACAVVFVVIVARGAWDYMAAEKERQLGADFAAATATPEKLQAFARSHAGHELAGVAWLQLGDEAYAAQRATEAVAHYEQATKVLKSGPLADRTKLGLAMSKVQAGQTEAGRTALQALVDNNKISRGARVEAAYHLASLAHAAGSAAAVRTQVERILSLDPSSPWAQRVMMLSLADAAPTGATAIAAPTTPAATAAEESAEPVIKLNLGQ